MLRCYDTVGVLLMIIIICDGMFFLQITSVVLGEDNL